MRVSREQMAINHTRILDEASHLFREHGFDAVTVTDVMKASGLTHGGFYGHFKSKDDLIVEVLSHILANNHTDIKDIDAWTDTYLSDAHRAKPATGCAVASFAGLMTQQTSAARIGLANGIETQINSLSNAMPGDDAAQKRREAIGQWSAMVGALVMARAVGDSPLAQELMAETRQWLAKSDVVAE